MKKFRILSTALFCVVTFLASAQTEENNLSVGTYCYELNDLDNSGNIYEAKVNVTDNNTVEGEIMVTYAPEKQFTVVFNGILIGETLKVTADYSNDVAQLPYDEMWKMSKQTFVGSHQPQVTMLSVGCKQ